MRSPAHSVRATLRKSREQVRQRVSGAVELTSCDAVDRAVVAMVVVGPDQLPVVRMCSSGHGSRPYARPRRIFAVVVEAVIIEDAAIDRVFVGAVDPVLAV